MKPISRSQGRSAVAAAAYRAGLSLTNARDDLTHDFTNKRGVLHAEIVLPEGVDAAWAQERSAESVRCEWLDVGIPALSQEASSLLQRLDGAVRDGDKAFAAALH